MDIKFQKLVELGVGEFEYINGTLIDHLKGTKKLLHEWGATIELQDAGLYHAVYGTAGFEKNLVSASQRSDISAIIGNTAEEIAYQYCACDRQDFFSKVGIDINPLFKNRFTGDSYYLSVDMLEHFCELTVANEVEIAIDNPTFIADYGAGLNYLFTQMAPYLSVHARARAVDEFGASIV